MLSDPSTDSRIERIAVTSGRDAARTALSGAAYRLRLSGATIVKNTTFESAGLLWYPRSVPLAGERISLDAAAKRHPKLSLPDRLLSRCAALPEFSAATAASSTGRHSSR